MLKETPTFIVLLQKVTVPHWSKNILPSIEAGRKIHNQPT
jgi:hypothetical protein